MEAHDPIGDNRNTAPLNRGPRDDSESLTSSLLGGSVPSKSELVPLQAVEPMHEQIVWTLTAFGLLETILNSTLKRTVVVRSDHGHDRAEILR